MKTDNKDIKKGNTFIRLWSILTILGFLSFAGQAFAQDDGARSYWKAREGTNVFSFQYLPMNMGASGSKAFAPGQFIYPNADISANIVMATWARHMTFLKRPSTFAVNIAGGNVGANLNANLSSEESSEPSTSSRDAKKSDDESSEGRVSPGWTIPVLLASIATLLAFRRLKGKSEIEK